MNTYINKHVFPQAPSPTMTSLRRISAIFTNTKHRSALLHVANEDAIDEQWNDQATRDRWFGLRFGG